MRNIIGKDINAKFNFYFSWGYFYFSAGLFCFKKILNLINEFNKFHSYTARCLLKV